MPAAGCACCSPRLGQLLHFERFPEPSQHEFLGATQHRGRRIATAALEQPAVIVVELVHQQAAQRALQVRSGSGCLATRAIAAHVGADAVDQAGKTAGVSHEIVGAGREAEIVAQVAVAGLEQRATQQPGAELHGELLEVPGQADPQVPGRVENAQAARRGLETAASLVDQRVTGKGEHREEDVIDGRGVHGRRTPVAHLVDRGVPEHERAVAEIGGLAAAGQRAAIGPEGARHVATDLLGIAGAKPGGCLLQRAGAGKRHDRWLAS